jgi:hypothetical protein
VRYTDPLGLVVPAAGAAVPAAEAAATLCAAFPVTCAVTGSAALWCYLYPEQCKEVLNQCLDFPPWMNAEEADTSVEPGPDHPYNPGKPTAEDGFKPQKNSDDKKTNKDGQWGWTDRKGNHWVPTNPGNAHGGPHWDVQKPGGGYVNVFPKKK